MNQSGYQDLLNNSVINSDQSVIYILILPNLDPNSVPYIDSNNTVQDLLLTDGQLVVGSTGAAPVAASITGTGDEVIVSNGPGSITLSTPQPIASTSSPTFNDLTLTSLNTIPISSYIITPSTSDLNMNSHSISNVVNLNGTAVSNYLKTPSTVNLDMNNHYISNFNSLRPIDSNVNIGNSTTLPLGGIGNIVLGDFTTTTANNAVCIGLQNIARGNSVAIGKETFAGTSATVVGYRSSCGVNTDTVIMGHDNVSSGGANADIFGVNQTNNQANTLLLGNGSYSNIRASGGVCDLGTAAVPFKDIYSTSSLVGTVKTSAINSIVTGPASATGDNLASYDLTTGKIIKDSGIAASTISGGPFLPLAGGTMTSGATTNQNTGSLTNVTNLNGTALTNYIITPSTIDLNMNTHSVTGVVNLNSKVANDIVTGPASATNNDVCTFNLSTGKIIKDSGVLITDLATNAGVAANYLALAGGTMVSAATINMNTGSLTNVTNIGGSVKTSAVNSIVTGPASATGDNICTYNSTTGKIIKDSLVSVFDVVTGPASATNNNLASYNLSSGKIIKDSGLLTSNVFLADGSISMSGVLNQANTTDSTLISNGSIVTLGGMGLTKAITAGGIIKSTLTTDSSSTSTGCFVGSGGLGLAKAITAGGIIKTTDTTDATTTTTGSIQGAGLGLSKAIFAGGKISTSDATDSTSTTTGSITCTGGIGVAKQIRGGSTLCVSTSGAFGKTTAATGIVEAVGAIFSTNNGGLSDKELLVDCNNAGTTCQITSYQQSIGVRNLTIAYNNLALAPGGTLSVGGGVGVIFLENCTTVPTANPTGGGILYVTGGALKFRGSGGTVTNIAAA